MRITNVVCSASLRCDLNLSQLCKGLANARYDPRRFSGAIWHHKIKGVRHNLDLHRLPTSTFVGNRNTRLPSFRQFPRVLLPGTLAPGTLAPEVTRHGVAGSKPYL